MKIGSRGSAAVDVVIGAAILIFVVMPVFSAIIERYILLNKIQIIRDAADITNISIYNSINTAELGKKAVSFDSSDVVERYKKLLCKNLNLNSVLAPERGSIAEDIVKVDSLELYTDNLPAVCSMGSVLTRPAVHSCITVPVKPSLYRQVVQGITGKSDVRLKIHVDSDIPVNN